MTSHFDASPFVQLSGVHQALIKPFPIGHLYHSSWHLSCLMRSQQVSGTGVAGGGRGSGGGSGGGMMVNLSLEGKRESSLLL